MTYGSGEDENKTHSKVQEYQEYIDLTADCEWSTICKDAESNKISINILSLQ